MNATESSSNPSTPAPADAPARLVRGLLYELRPLPAAAAVATALAGAFAAGAGFDGAAWAPFGLLVLLGLYVGHLVDSLIDYHVRHEPKFVYMGVFEDSGGLLSARELATAAAIGTAAFAALAASLGRADLGLIAAAGLFLAVGHATMLDKNPITVSLGYPTGVALAFLGGFLTQTPTLAREAILTVAPLWLFLVGGKIVSDLIDHDADAAIRKTTVPVLLGPRRGRVFGYAVCAAGLAAAAFTAPGLLVLAGVSAATVLTIASTRMAVARGVLVLVAGGFAYLGALLASLA